VHTDVAETLIDRDRIARRVAAMAAEINRDLQELEPAGEIVLVSVLTGSIIFLADLIRHLPQKLSIEVVTVSSYPGATTESRGAEIVSPLAGKLYGRHVLLVDDILDSGGTLRTLRRELAKQKPASLRACVLLRKKREAALATPCEYVGFDIPDVFVVGYGLDYNNYYRNLPDIATLKGEAM
jgi:hypoxanthine phosphoribosyltransferase